MSEHRGPVLVTGASGFIGSHLLGALRARQPDAVGIDVQSKPGILHLDVRDRDAVDRVMSRWRPRAVVHLAARVGARPSVRDPDGYRQTNVHGTNNLLQSAARHGVGHFVFVSSCAVYGRSPELRSRETDPLRPQSPYADTKVQAEALVRSYTKPGMTTTVVRPFSVYGPRMRPDLVLHGFVDALKNGRSIRLFGDGSTQRDFIHVDDVTHGLISIIERPAPGHRVFNLGSGEPWTLLEVVDLLATAMGRAPHVELAPPDPADPPRTCSCPAKIRQALGFQPTIPLEEGLSDLARGYRAASRFPKRDEAATAAPL